MPKEKEKDDDTPEKEPELVIVTDDEKNLEAEPGPQTDDEDQPSKKKAAPKSEDSDDDEDEDEDDREESRLGASEEDEAEEERKKKSSHKSRRQRKREGEMRLRRERDYLEARNTQLEQQLQALARRMDASDRSTLEERIARNKALIERADKVIADAISKSKGDEAAEATKLRDQFRDDLRVLEARKKVVETPAEEEPLPPVVRKNAQDWMRRTSWFDPQLRDQDSKIVRALDVAINEEGYDPGTVEYFEELDRRIAKFLPHRAKKRSGNGRDPEDDDEDEDEEEERPSKRRRPEPRRKSGGPRFRTGGPGRELKPNEVYLNAERIRALKDHGVWDDPEERQKYLRRFAEWDRQHQTE